MARMPRREVIDESQVGVYHCINRCVRRAYLCGEDALTGRNYEHRKEWVRGRMEVLALDDARRLVTNYVAEYNEVRLHSALGYVTPIDKLRGREQEVFAERDRKLETAREERRCGRRDESCYNRDTGSEDRALLASGHRPKVGPSADPRPEASVEGDQALPEASSNLFLA